jgi:hypothetical protein
VSGSESGQRIMLTPAFVVSQVQEEGTIAIERNCGSGKIVKNVNGCARYPIYLFKGGHDHLQESHDGLKFGPQNDALRVSNI